MARIPMVGGFDLCPEGEHVFYIYDVTYDEEFGKLKVKMVTAKGDRHIERFSLKDRNGGPNEKAMSAFSFFAKTILDDFEVEDIDHTDLIGHYLRATVIHNKMPSNKDSSKTVTFANLDREKEPATGFDTEPIEEVRKMIQPKAAPASSVNLDDLLGD